MEKLTPEGAAARRTLAERTGISAAENEDWNAIASAAVEASEEVKRLRDRVKELERDGAVKALPAVMEALSNLRPDNLGPNTCFDALEDCGACEYCTGDDLA